VEIIKKFPINRIYVGKHMEGISTRNAVYGIWIYIFLKYLLKFYFKKFWIL